MRDGCEDVRRSCPVAVRTVCGPALAVLLAVVIGLEAPLGACACCADEGLWSEITRRFTPEELAEIGRLNLADEARLQTGPAGLEAARGVREPADSYRLRHRRPNRRWSLDLQDGTGAKATLTFNIPDRATFLAIDLQDGEQAAAGGPLVYKEWRMEGPITGSAAFAGGTFRLILQGRGMMCPDAAQFRTWILQVRGTGVSYALYGRLDAADSRLGTIPPGRF